VITDELIKLNHSRFYYLYSLVRIREKWIFTAKCSKGSKHSHYAQELAHWILYCGVWAKRKWQGWIWG